MFGKILVSENQPFAILRIPTHQADDRKDLAAHTAVHHLRSGIIDPVSRTGRGKDAQAASAAGLNLPLIGELRVEIGARRSVTAERSPGHVKPAHYAASSIWDDGRCSASTASDG